MDAAWKTDRGNEGQARLESLVAPQWSTKEQKTISWSDFRKEVHKLERHSWVFRGQAAPWALRTCFHRRGRYDLIRYGTEDMEAMHRVFVSATNQWLDLADPLKYASLMALAQHHGYPTPLLDWTYSPYIAAYFAVRDAGPSDAPSGPRIYTFHAEQWRSTSHQAQSIMDPVPAMTVLDAVPFWNPRAAQQQSITTMINVDHVEKFIDSIAQPAPVLSWFDFDRNERESILDELQWMGVTESLLFPGIEGSFKALARGRFPK